MLVCAGACVCICVCVYALRIKIVSTKTILRFINTIIITKKSALLSGAARSSAFPFTGCVCVCVCV